MKRRISWMLLMPALVAAAIAFTLVVCGYVRPHIAAVELFNLVELTRRISFGSLGLTLLLGLPIALWFRGLTVKWRKALPWYLHACPIIAVLAFCEIYLSLSDAIKYEAGKWMMSRGQGYGWQETSELQAVASLWGTLRAYAAFLLFITMLWVICGGMLILDRIQTVPVNGQTDTEKMPEESLEGHPAVDLKAKRASSPSMLWQGKMVRVRSRLVPYLLWTVSSIDVFLEDRRLLHVAGKCKVIRTFSEGGMEHQIELNRERSRNLRTQYQLRIDGVVVVDSHVDVENRFMMMVPIIVILASLFVIFNLYYGRLWHQ